MKEERITDYKMYESIFLGEHSSAFNIITKNDFDKAMVGLRYLVVNFGGMISRLSADMLFEEFPKINAGENDDFVQGLIEDNNFKTQCYESALENSFRGDAVFKIRSDNERVIIEDVNPQYYFPEYDSSNVRKEPVAHIFKFPVKLKISNESKEAIFEERHEKGKIIYSIYSEENGVKKMVYNLKDFFPDLEEEQMTNVNDEFLVVHIPNYRINSKFYGISDYNDLITLFYAINNRLTKIDNILDKHGDPILMVPKGVLNEDGEVNRPMLGVIEIGDEGSKNPEYIVWDAKLDSAFKEIEKLVEFLFIVSETSPASFGLDKEGQAESGRALKFKLLRTIAKKNRKAMYYDLGIKKLLFIAQKFAKNNNYKTLQGIESKEPAKIEIEWQDGVINDLVETLNAEQIKLSEGLTTKKESIMRIEGIDEKEAEKKVKEIEKEKKDTMPDFSTNPLLKENDENNEQPNTI